MRTRVTVCVAGAGAKSRRIKAEDPAVGAPTSGATGVRRAPGALSLRARRDVSRRVKDLRVNPTDADAIGFEDDDRRGELIAVD